MPTRTALISVDPVHLPRQPHPLPPVILTALDRQDGAVATTQLSTVMSRERIASLVRAGVLHRLWRGAYCVPHRSDDVLTWLSAADLTGNSEVVAYGRTAAGLFGFPSGPHDPALHLWTPSSRPSTNPHFVMHRDDLSLPLVRVNGHRAVSRAETAVALAATEEGPHALAVLDGALRAGVRRSALEVVAVASSRRGIIAARTLIGWADRTAESPGESWVRWAVLDAGLPTPILQLPVTTRSGGHFRLDLAWPELRLAVEYDGVAFHTGAHLFNDRARLNDLVAEGWTVIHVTAAMVFGSRHSLIGRLSAYF